MDNKWCDKQHGQQVVRQTTWTTRGATHNMDNKWCDTQQRQQVVDTQHGKQVVRHTTWTTSGATHNMDNKRCDTQHGQQEARHTTETTRGATHNMDNKWCDTQHGQQVVRHTTWTTRDATHNMDNNWWTHNMENKLYDTQHRQQDVRHTTWTTRDAAHNMDNKWCDKQHGQQVVRHTTWTTRDAAHNMDNKWCDKQHGQQAVRHTTETTSSGHTTWKTSGATHNMDNKWCDKQHGQQAVRHTTETTSSGHTTWKTSGATHNMDNKMCDTQHGQQEMRHTTWTTSGATNNMDNKQCDTQQRQQVVDTQHGKQVVRHTTWKTSGATHNMDNKWCDTQHGQQEMRHTTWTTRGATHNRDNKSRSYVNQCLSQTGWVGSEGGMNCSVGTYYHCLYQEGVGNVEACLDRKVIKKGFCPQYDRVSQTIVSVACREGRGTCSSMDFWSNDAGNFTACTNHSISTETGRDRDSVMLTEPDFLVVVVPVAIAVLVVLAVVVILWYWFCHRRKRVSRETNRRDIHSDQHVYIAELHPMIVQNGNNQRHEAAEPEGAYDEPVFLDDNGTERTDHTGGGRNDSHHYELPPDDGLDISPCDGKCHYELPPDDSLDMSPCDEKDHSFSRSFIHYPFVETASLRRAVDILHCHKIIVMVGYTGSGKTYNGMMILDRYKKNRDDDTDIRNTLLDWNVVKLSRTKEHMYVLFDDCFGRFCGVDPKLEENVGMLDVILSDVNMKGSPFYVIITVPFTIWSKHPDYFKRLNAKFVIHLSMDRYCLTKEERRGILLHHLENKGLHDKMTDPFVDDVVDNTVDSLVGFPILCYLFSEESRLFPDRYTFFKDPRYTFSIFIRTLPDKNVYLTLVYALFQGGRIEKGTKNVDLIHEISSVFRVSTFCSSAIDHVMTYMNKAFLNAHDEDQFYELQHDFVTECVYISLDIEEIAHLKPFSNRNDVLDELVENYN